MKVTGTLLKILQKDFSGKDEELYPVEELKKALTGLTYPVLIEKSAQMFDLFLQNNSFPLDDLRTCFLGLHKVFSYYLKEDGIGIIKTLDFRRGSIKIAENVALPCEIMEGIIKALLKKTNSRATTVKHQKCKKDGMKFCEYQVTWMVSNVG